MCESVAAVIGGGGSLDVGDGGNDIDEAGIETEKSFVKVAVHSFMVLQYIWTSET